ncbi:MAG: hypothetical protein H7235_03660 [Bdellovibrionaceae bacterium]|nr:hypothetical protein [Pseudobdellovibrionaceae bacterium]
MSRSYPHIDYASGNTYLVRIFSSKKDDWRIDVHDSNNNFIEYITHHEFLDVPPSLKVAILLDINRACSNIEADTNAKKVK